MRPVNFFFLIFTNGSSRSWTFFKTGDLKNSAVFIRKHTPVLGSVFNKDTLKFFIKKRL